MALAAIIVSILSFIVSAIGLRAARRSNLISEIDLLTSLQSEWGDLQEQWERANLTVYGSNNYYSLGSKELRAEFDNLVEEISSGHLSQHEAQAAAFPWTSAIREIVDYFGSVASYILTGQLAPARAYELFGGPVVRRSRVVRAILGDRKLALGGTPSDTTVHFIGYKPARYSDTWSQGLEHDWVEQWMNAGQFTGRTERILCLLDVLWAEAALREDMYRHDIVKAATVKRDYAAGLRNRKRIKRVTRQLGGSWLLALRLQWRLTHSEVVAELPEVESFYRKANEIKNYGDPSLSGGKIRRLRILIAGMLNNRVTHLIALRLKRIRPKLALRQR
jgi:hypothetical protein